MFTLRSILLAGLIIGSIIPSARGDFIFSTNAVWGYFKGFSEASSPDTTAWRGANFDDSGWSSGAAPFYYEHNAGSATAYSGNTDLTDMWSGYTCIFLRRTFVLTNVAELTALKLTALSDDGFIAWINGIQVARFNMPSGEIPYDGSSSPAVAEPVPTQEFTLVAPQTVLVPGTNVIAIQAFNSSLAASSDFVIWATLSASTSKIWSTVGISEIAITNETDVRDQDGDNSPWIEIYNPTTRNMDLHNWSLTDDAGNPGKWRFPDISIGGKDFIVVFASGKYRTTNTAELHTNFKLSPDGGFLALADPDGNIVSVFNSYPAVPPGMSYGRDVVNPNSTGFFSDPTPGKPNAVSGSGFSPEVEFSRAGGTYLNPFNLQLSVANTNAVIRYTLDGTLPTEDSDVYTGPFSVTDSVQVRARAFTPASRPGPLRSESFLRLNSSVIYSSSDLPALVIDNFGSGAVPQSENQFANVSIYEPINGRASLTNAPTLTSRAGIHVHGSTTAGLPKQSFSVEFRDELDNDTDLSPLGLPAESDWILYAPDNFDPVLIHNPLIYQLSNDIGRYAPRTRFVEVYLNTSGGPLSSADYNGIYVLEEKPKWGADRVAINKLHSVDDLHPFDNDSTNVTGGYLVKIDRLGEGETGFYAAGQSMVYVNPKEDDIKTPQRAPQRQFLTDYINAFGDALNGSGYSNPTNGFRVYVDVPSWIDHHILNVLAFNVDALRLSAYFYKDRDGKLGFGPIWDFDRSQGSTDGRDFNPMIWRAPIPDYGTDFFNYSWWGRMFTDPDFWQAWIDRYEDLREGALSTNHIFSVIDAMAAQVQHEEPREAYRWPSLTQPRTGLVSISGYSFNFSGTYQGEVNFLKQWYADRLHFMDTNFLPKPVFSDTNGAIVPGFTLAMAASTGAAIYYTTNGSDPRLPGGGVSPEALQYLSPIGLATDTTILARAYDSNHRNLTGDNNPPLSSPWSGMASNSFVVAAPPVVLKTSEDLEAYIGQNPTFSVQATGAPLPAYQWSTNTTDLSGQTNSQLTLTNIQINQTGTYSVTLSNRAGSTNVSFVLTVTPKPDLFITEVMSSESKGATNSTLDRADWWELSNLGTFPVRLRGFRFDDDHNSFSDAVTFTNDISISPGESVVFVEDMTAAQFRSWWGAERLPQNLQIIPYSGIGFGSDGDAVNVWNAAANFLTDTVASVTFGAAARGVSFGFDPATRVFGALSIAGESGAFVAAVNGDIGSPGTILNLPRVTEAGCDGDGGFKLSFTAQPGLHYEIEYTTSLSVADWIALTNFSVTSSPCIWNDPDSRTNSARFYRIRLTP